MQRLYPPTSLTAGFIAAYAGAEPPAGWLACDGRAVKRADYPELYATIGTAYGQGDGTTTFNLPELRARFPLGADAYHPMGSMAGEYEHVLTTEEMPSHGHNSDIYYADNGGGSTGHTSYWGNHRGTRTWCQASGGGTAHNNMPPYTVVNYVISTGKEQ